jgi:CheY-like chemotaxis protein
VGIHEVFQGKLSVSALEEGVGGVSLGRNTDFRKLANAASPLSILTVFSLGPLSLNCDVNQEFPVDAANRPRIILSDDHPALLAEAALILRQNYELVGTASNGLELLDCARRLNPDLLVLDIAMPGLDGFEATRRLRLAGRQCKIVFLTVWEDADFVREALQLGANAYVVKARMATDLLPAISEALANRQFISPTLQL